MRQEPPAGKALEGAIAASDGAADGAAGGPRGGRRAALRDGAPHPRGGANLAEFGNILQIFGGLVLGCIEAEKLVSCVCNSSIQTRYLAGFDFDRIPFKEPGFCCGAEEEKKRRGAKR